jgi:hypothetical protein
MRPLSTPKKLTVSKGAWRCLFLLHALEQGASACPDKSGHTRNADLTMIRHVGRCPDLLGPAGALHRGHETKKDISMLYI